MPYKWSQVYNAFAEGGIVQYASLGGIVKLGRLFNDLVKRHIANEPNNNVDATER